MKIKATIINHPRRMFDLVDIDFTPTTPQIPTSATFMFENTPHVILVYAPDAHTELPKANGYIPAAKRFSSVWQFIRRRQTLENLSNFRYLTLEYIYGYVSNNHKPKEISARWGTPKAFVDSVADGHIWEDPTTMSPYELGAELSLDEVKRQVRKQRYKELAQQLDSTVKWMVGGLLIALVFLTIILAGK
jgi:hypothetical protein